MVHLTQRPKKPLTTKKKFFLLFLFSYLMMISSSFYTIYVLYSLHENYQSAYSGIVFLAVSNIFITIGFLIGVNMMDKHFFKPIENLIDHTKKISSGDFRIEPLPLQGKGEMNDLTFLFNEMVRNIKSLVKEIQSTSKKVANSSKDLYAHAKEHRSVSSKISSTIEEVAEGALFQMKGATESAQAMEEMAVGIHRIAQTSNVVADSSKHASDEAEKGNEALKKVFLQMNSIHEISNRSTKVVLLLEKKSQEISKILELSTYISEQINMLALNASIESEHAGVHGEGFAVVADEVKSLAEQSAESSDNIHRIVEEIQREIKNVIATINSAKKEVESGLQVVDETQLVFKRILHSTRLSAEQIREITAASEQLSASTQQIIETVENSTDIAKRSSEISQNVAASVKQQLVSIEDVALSSSSLRNLSKELEEQINHFKVREQTLPSAE